MQEEELTRRLDQRAREVLPRLYSDPVHYDLLAQMTAPDDLPFYRQLVEARGGPVLELGCGTGRVTLPLARLGVEVVGLELSSEMLSFAVQKAGAEGLELTFARADLRSFDLERTFPLLLLPYNTLNHLLDDASLAGALQSIRRHMDDESRLVIDTFQPSPAFLGDAPERRRPILRFIDPYLEKETVLSEENHYEPATQLNRVVWSYSVDGVEDARREEMTMRLFWPRELDAWLFHEGFEIESKLGDYDRRPFDSESPKQLVICRKRPASRCVAEGEGVPRS